MALRDLTLPRLGETMESARLVRWLKQPGETIARGEPLLEVETDKTIAELPSLLAGRLVEQLSAEGEDVIVGDVIGRIEVDGSDDVAAATPSATPPAASGVEPARNPPAATLRPASTAPGGARATPAARAAARARGVELSAIVGSGRRGRIEARDVDDPLARRSAPAPRSVGPLAMLDSEGSAAPSSGGPRPTVLLIHGFAGDRTVWAALVSGLVAAGLRVIAPDLPSHGQSTSEAASLEDIDLALGQLVDALALADSTPLHLVGHSLGAIAATRLAARIERRATSLTLLAPAGIGREIASDFIHGMAGVQGAGELAHLLRHFGMRGAGVSDPMLEEMAAELARGRLGALAGALAAPGGGQRADILRLLAKLAPRLPVRVVIGRDDRVMPAAQLLDLPPRVAVHLFGESGHMPMWDQPRELLDLIVAGVAGVHRHG